MLLTRTLQVEPLKFGSWTRYAVALSAPGAAGFPVPYTFTLSAAGPFLQAAGASEWGASLQDGKVCPNDCLVYGAVAQLRKFASGTRLLVGRACVCSDRVLATLSLSVLGCCALGSAAFLWPCTGSPD